MHFCTENSVKQVLSSSNLHSNATFLCNSIYGNLADRFPLTTVSKYANDRGQSAGQGTVNSGTPSCLLKCGVPHYVRSTTLITFYVC